MTGWVKGAKPSGPQALPRRSTATIGQQPMRLHRAQEVRTKVRRLGDPMQLTVAQIASLVDDKPSSEVLKPKDPVPVNGVTLKKLDAHFRIEKLDPRHRPGSLLLMALDVAQWSAKDHEPFFPWIDSLRLPEALAMFERWHQRPLSPAERGALRDGFFHSVEYFSASRAEVYRVCLSDKTGLLHSAGELLDTHGTTTALGGDDAYIWVMSREQHFYTARHQVNRLHHSSFQAGRAIVAGGEWTVEQGRIRLITGRTGHYKIGKEHFTAALEALQRKGADLSLARVRLYRQGVVQDVKVTTYLSVCARDEQWQLFAQAPGSH